jgi:hypothetical protein
VKRFDLWELDREELKEFLLAEGTMNYHVAVLRIAELYRLKYRPYAKLMGLKNPNGVFHLPLTFEMFPAAGVIHIVRDVRGVFASEKKKRIKEGYFDASAVLFRVVKDYKRAFKVSKFYSENAKVYSVVYEHFIRQPAREIEKLLDWLGVEYDERVLDYASRAKEASGTPNSELWQHSKTLEAPDASRIDAYLGELSNQELKAVELGCFKELKHRGYEVKITWSHIIAGRLLLRAYCKGYWERIKSTLSN